MSDLMKSTDYSMKLIYKKFSQYPSRDTDTFIRAINKFQNYTNTKVESSFKFVKINTIRQILNILLEYACWLKSVIMVHRRPPDLPDIRSIPLKK